MNKWVLETIKPETSLEEKLITKAVLLQEHHKKAVTSALTFYGSMQLSQQKNRSNRTLKTPKTAHYMQPTP